MNEINSKTVSVNLVWRLAERFGAQGVNFILSIIIARLLDPEQFGVVALLTVFISILQVFIDSGLGNSLIQKKDADNVDFSTVFFFNIAICLILYLILFFSAPAISLFYKNDSLTSLTRVLGLILIISGVKNVQQAYVSRNMMFKRFFYSTLGGTLVSAVVGIVLAYKGAGAWALVIQQVMNMFIDTVILWITVKWRPQLVFSKIRLKALFSYGWKLLASNLLETVYNNIRTLIIGKVFSSADLAYYNKGRQFPYFMVTSINSSIDSVLLPAMSYVQDDGNRVKEMTRRAIKTSCFIIWPIMVGLAVCAKPLVQILLTEKWLSAVPFVQIFCFNFAFWPIHTANLNAIKAIGRSDVFLRLEVEKKIIGLISIVVAIPFGVMAIAIAFAITAPISSIINASPSRKLLDYSISDQIKDLLPSFFLSIIMGCIIWPVSLLKIAPVLTLVIQIIAGVIVYASLAYLLKLETFSYIIKLVKKMTHKDKE